jgi:glycosyltransferase involved in cell wall biosynthesis
MPQVSIITPTFNRQNLLPVLWEYVRGQTVQDFEWLVHDSSQRPAELFTEFEDARVTYIHASQAITVGAKRNYLCDMAKGDVIAQFDDDDFYSPRYIENMMKLMHDKNADFVKLFGFFLYQPKHNVLAYWDLERDFPLHFRLPLVDQPFPILNIGGIPDKWGYGFSYVYRRKVWQAIQFPDRNFQEDQVFADQAIKKFNSAGAQDFARSCLHIIHANNTSIAFPQQILPADNRGILFPLFRS